MKNFEIVNYALDSLKNKGAQKAQCIGTFSTTWELTALSGNIELLRTINDETSIDMKGYFDNKMGGISISTSDLKVIDEAAQSCLGIDRAGVKGLLQIGDLKHPFPLPSVRLPAPVASAL